MSVVFAKESSHLPACEDVRHLDGRMSPGIHGLSAREWQAWGSALGCLFSSVASLYSTTTISQMNSPAQENIFTVICGSQ